MVDAARGHPANVDETGMGKGRWLWVMVTAVATVFRIAGGRTRAAFTDLVGTAYRSVLTTDRYRTYDHLPDWRHQLCWSHLRRDFQAMIDRLTYGDLANASPALQLSGAKAAYEAGLAKAQTGDVSAIADLSPLAEVVGSFGASAQVDVDLSIDQPGPAHFARVRLVLEGGLWRWTAKEGCCMSRNGTPAFFLPPDDAVVQALLAGLALRNGRTALAWAEAA